VKLHARPGWGTAAGIALLVAAALAVVVGAAALVGSHDRELAAQQAFARATVERAASLALLLEDVAPAERGAMLARFRAGEFRVWLAEVPPPPERSWRHGAEIEEAARAAAPGWARSMVVRALAGQPRPPEPGEAAGEPERRDWRPGFYTLVVALPLSDGTWLVAAAPARPLGRPPRGLALAGLGLVVLATVTAALVVARRMARPLVLLAGAAERLSLDLDAPPLPERGPREMRRAAAAFNVMQERLRRLVDDRSLMLAALSHDMRTVITRLRLRAEEIGDEGQRAKALEDLADMEVMLREALEAARGETAREPRRTVDLATLAASLVDDLADAGRAARYEGPQRLATACRPVALRRALANLIDNALRYGGQAEVVLRETPAAIEIDVADRGPGVPDALKEEMFRPFMRGDPSRSRETGGSGLGLGVARSILRAHGGDVVLLDRPGGGLVARCTLPRAAAA